MDDVTHLYVWYIWMSPEACSEVTQMLHPPVTHVNDVTHIQWHTYTWDKTWMMWHVWMSPEACSEMTPILRALVTSHIRMKAETSMTPHMWMKHVNDSREWLLRHAVRWLQYSIQYSIHMSYHTYTNDVTYMNVGWGKDDVTDVNAWHIWMNPDACWEVTRILKSLVTWHIWMTWHMWRRTEGTWLLYSIHQSRRTPPYGTHWDGSWHTWSHRVHTHTHVHPHTQPHTHSHPHTYTHIHRRSTCQWQQKERPWCDQHSMPSCNLHLLPPVCIMLCVYFVLM